MNKKIASGFLAFSLIFQFGTIGLSYADTENYMESDEMLSNIEKTGIDEFLDGNNITKRIYGNNRVETSVKISEFANNFSEKVIIADAANYPDALSASNLSQGKYPVLLVNGSLSEKTVNEINRLGSEEAIILGGNISVKTEVEDKIKQLPSIKKVIRVSGKNRYDTCLKTLTMSEKKSLVLASGQNYPDALAASSIIDEAGLILTKKDKISSNANIVFNEIEDKNIKIIGGTNSVTDYLVDSLKDKFNISGIERIHGKNRYQTSVKIADMNKSENIIVASGESFPDALAASELSQKTGFPIILVKKNYIDKSVLDYIKNNKIKKAIILGGESSVSKTTEKNIEKLIKGEEIKQDSYISEKNLFKPVPINQSVKSRIYGKSYKPNKNIQISDLCYIPVAYRDFNNNTAYGELIVNKNVGHEVGNIFKEIYQEGIKIEKIRLIDEYNADDVKSMEDNNTSAFNYRVIKGTNSLSKHSLGYAIDINPLYNPHVVNGVANPRKAQSYAKRDRNHPYMIFKNDKTYNIFKKYGWKWGGNWRHPDHQHFEK